jgi:sensor histidine kinase YesM
MNKNSRYTLFAYVSIWLAWMSLHVLVLFLAGMSFNTALLDSILSNIPLVLLSLVLSNILRFYQPGPKHAWKVVIWCIVVAIIWLGLNGFLTSFILSYDQHFIAFYESGLLLRFFIALLLLVLSALIAWIIQLFINSEEENKRHFESEKLAKEAELNNLRQQLQPHFLFNTLNSVNALVTVNPAAARKMIHELSDFLRGTVRKDNESHISVEEELKHLQLYLAIEKVRFGHRMNTLIDVDEKVLKHNIPPLILLPLIENAIKYGLYDTLGNVEIKLNVKMTNGFIEISVTNPYDPDSSDRHKGLGFGLQTLSRRLFLIYGRKDLLSIKDENNTFTTSLKIPVA